MTHDEAKKIAAIVSTADDGCSRRVNELCELLSAAFPEYRWRLAANEAEEAQWEATMDLPETHELSGLPVFVERAEDGAERG